MHLTSLILPLPPQLAASRAECETKAGEHSALLAAHNQLCAAHEDLTRASQDLQPLRGRVHTLEVALEGAQGRLAEAKEREEQLRAQVRSEGEGQSVWLRVWLGLQGLGD